MLRRGQWEPTSWSWISLPLEKSHLSFSSPLCLRSRGSSRWCWRAGRTEERPVLSKSRSCSCCWRSGPRSHGPSAAVWAECPPTDAGLQSWGSPVSAGRTGSASRASWGTESARCRCRGNSRRRPWLGWRRNWSAAETEDTAVFRQTLYTLFKIIHFQLRFLLRCTGLWSFSVLRL